MKRYISAFDDTEEDPSVSLNDKGAAAAAIYDDGDEDYYPSSSDYETEEPAAVIKASTQFLSDDGDDSYDDDKTCASSSSHSEDSETTRKQKRVKFLNERYAEPLKNCYEAIKDRLTWTESFYLPVLPADAPPVPTANEKSTWTTKKGRDRRGKNRFGEARRFELGVNFDRSKDPITIVEKKPPVPSEDRVCKYAATGKRCPFGSECKFSHSTSSSSSRQRQEVSGSDGQRKSKKIWMCKNEKARKGSCRFGDNCVYAHSIEEVARTASRCNNYRHCKYVRFDGVKYDNAPGIDRKCNRYHDRETIGNFVDRTS